MRVIQEMRLIWSMSYLGEIIVDLYDQHSYD